MTIKMSDEELNSHYHEALANGVFRGVSERAIGLGKRYDLRHGDGWVYTRILGADQQSWFKTQNGRQNFNVFTVVRAVEAEDTIKRLVNHQVGAGSTQKDFRDIFGNHSVKATTHEFYDGESHSGVLVRVPVLELPEGQGGGLGERLFSYAYNAFARPGLAVRWGELPGGELAYRALSKWVDFSAPGITGRF